MNEEEAQYGGFWRLPVQVRAACSNVTVVAATLGWDGVQGRACYVHMPHTVRSFYHCEEQEEWCPVVQPSCTFSACLLFPTCISPPVPYPTPYLPFTYQPNKTPNFNDPPPTPPPISTSQESYLSLANKTLLFLTEAARRYDAKCAGREGREGGGVGGGLAA